MFDGISGKFVDYHRNHHSFARVATINGRDHRLDALSMCLLERLKCLIDDST